MGCVPNGTLVEWRGYFSTNIASLTGLRGHVVDACLPTLHTLRDFGGDGVVTFLPTLRP